MLTELNLAQSRKLFKQKINIPNTFKGYYVSDILYNTKFAWVTYFSEVFNTKLG